MIKAYFAHLAANWAVAARAFILATFHFIHGLIPTRWTDHDYWGL